MWIVTKAPDEGEVPVVLCMKRESRSNVSRMGMRRINIDRATMFGFTAILLWSATVALARSISEKVGPSTAGASVFLTGGLLLLGKLFLKDRSIHRLRKLPRAYLLGCGALFFIYAAALFWALGLAQNRQQSIEVGLVNYLWPTLTILFSLSILTNRANLWLIPGTLLAFTGVFIVLTQDSSISFSSFSINLLRNPVAYGLGLVAAISWALYSNLTRRLCASDSVGAVPLFVMAAGLMFLTIRLLFPEENSWGIRVAIEVALLGLVTALAYVFWDIAMRKGDVVLAASCSYLTPFLSTVFACIYLQVMPGISLWLGCLLIIGGSFLSWRSVTQQKHAETT